MTNKGLSMSMFKWILERCLRVLTTPVNFLGFQTDLLSVMLWELVAILVIDIILRIFNNN